MKEWIEQWFTDCLRVSFCIFPLQHTFKKYCITNDSPDTSNEFSNVSENDMPCQTGNTNLCYTSNE